MATKKGYRTWADLKTCFVSCCEPLIGVVDEGGEDDPVSGQPFFQSNKLIGLGDSQGRIQIVVDDIIQSNYGQNKTFDFDPVTGEIDLSYNGSVWEEGSSLYIDLVCNCTDGGTGGGSADCDCVVLKTNDLLNDSQLILNLVDSDTVLIHDLGGGDIQFECLCTGESGAGNIYSVDNGLTEDVPGNFQWGGLLLHNTTIDNDGFITAIMGDGKVGINTLAPQGKVTIADDTLLNLAVDTSGLMLINNTPATGGLTTMKYSPSLVLAGKGFDNTLSQSYGLRFRAYARPNSLATNFLSTSGLVIDQSIDDGATYQNLFVLNMGYGTGFITMGGNGFGSVSNILSSLTVPNLYTNQGILATAGTVVLPGGVASTSDPHTFIVNMTIQDGVGSSIATIRLKGGINNSGGTSTYRGIYYTPMLNALFGTTHIAIQTESGDHLFGTVSGRTGIGANTTIDNSSILDITSTAKGLLPPRMTTTQKNKIHGDVSGTLIGGSLYPNGKYRLGLAGGSGSGLVADITVAGGIVTLVEPYASNAAGYVVGDILSTVIGITGSGFSYTLTSVNPPSEGLEVYDLTVHKKYVYDATVWQPCW